MIGLRKVVKLRIVDLPEGEMKLNKDNNNYHYYWKNRYYIGKLELFKSKRYENNDDEYLDRLIDSIVSIDNDYEKNIVKENDYLYYANGESSIYYFGNKTNDIKKKILRKKD